MELVATIRDDSGQSVGSVIVAPKTFGTLSEGFFGQRKIAWDGARYQVQVQLVRINSKPEAEAEAAPEA
jgi:hypothetical protein